MFKAKERKSETKLFLDPSVLYFNYLGIPGIPELKYINNHLYFASSSWNYSPVFCVRRFGFFTFFLTFQLYSLACKRELLIARFTCCAQESGRKKKTVALASAEFFLWTGIVPSVRCQLKPVVSVAVNLTQALKRLSEPLGHLSWESQAEPSAQPAWRNLPVF